jgi:F-type H+-transporting ATPase subunit a
MTPFTQFAAEGLHISISAEPVFHIGGFAITNSMLLGVGGYILVLGWLMYVARAARDDRKKGFFTRLAIWCFTGLYKTVSDIVPNQRIRKLVAPLAISLFFYIAIQYYLGILPIVGEAITVDGKPLLRGPDADLNLTFGLAILAMIMVQVFAVIKHGLGGNLRRYFRNPIKNPMGAFEGILELVGEFSRLLALSIRLFGNVFAGEVLLTVVIWLTHFASPALLPVFYIFELFIGGIQAYVFFMLTTVFTGLAVADHGDHSTEHSPADDKKLVASVT